MQKQTIKSKQEGFTIIEVLIVLAIAALILLVVFLAVPGLQRSQRNNGRVNDASRISAAVTAYLGNNQNSLPSTANDAQSIYADSGAGKYLLNIANYNLRTTVATCKITATNADICVPATLPAVDSAMTTANASPGISGDAVLIIPQGVCSGSGGYAIVKRGTSTQIAVQYTTETAAAPWNIVCIQAQ